MTSTEIDTVKRVKTFNNWECFGLICKKFLTQKSNFYQRLAKYFQQNTIEKWLVSNFGFWARSVRPDSVPTDQSETFQSCRFSPKLIQSWTFQSQNNSVPDTSVPQQFSPKQFSPKTLQSQNFQSKNFQSQTVQSQNNSVQIKSVPIQLSPRNFSPKTIQSRTDQPQINLCTTKFLGLYTIQNYKDCKQYKIIKIVNNTKLYELFISPGNLQDGLHQVYE